MSITMTPGNGPGTQRIATWVAGAFLVPIVLSVFSMMFSAVIGHGQRVASLEAEFREIKDNLKRMDHKLDWLMEHHRP
jgi:hypothetical protein